MMRRWWEWIRAHMRRQRTPYSDFHLLQQWEPEDQLIEDAKRRIAHVLEQLNRGEPRPHP